MRGRGKNLSEVKALHERIETWRRARKNRREPMPEPLWDAAVKAAGLHGVFAISNELRLNYMRLKARSAAVKKEKPAAFVELKAPALLAAPGQGAELELTTAAGEKLVIRMASGEKLDVLGLIAGFLSRTK